MSSIICPRCGSPVPSRRFFGPTNKPFCARCGWNLDRAEAALDSKRTILELIPLGIAGVLLFAIFTASRADLPFIFIVPALFALVAIAPVWSYYSMRRAIAAAKFTVNPSLAIAQPPPDSSLQMLQALPRPRGVRFRLQGSLGVVAVLVVAVVGLAVFFLTGAQAHGRKFHDGKDSLLMLLPLVFLLFVFVLLIVVPLLREKRNVPLLRDGELAFGRVLAQQTVQQGKASFSKIEFEFRTSSGQLVRNSQRDLSGQVFEDMMIPVFYDPLDPTKNTALCASYLKISGVPGQF